MTKSMIDPAALETLLPMHLLLAPDGVILSAGAALRRLIGPATTFAQALRPERQQTLAPDGLPHLGCDGRVFLSPSGHPATVLRGNAVRLDDGGMLLNLGFGIGLAEAVRRHNLTERDFAAAELAMELLFLHEANAAMLGELSRANMRLEQARLAAETQAFTDPLTGLYNRRGFEIAADMVLRSVRFGTVEAPGAGFALLHLDLDLFKDVNDRHGHGAGDEMLRAVAHKLRAETRADDTVARIGGDEFVLILPGVTDVATLNRLGRRIIDSIEAPVAIGDTACTISASIGVALSSSYDAQDIAQMLEDADRALYVAKGQGRGRMVIDGVPEQAHPPRQSAACLTA